MIPLTATLGACLWITCSLAAGVTSVKPTNCQGQGTWDGWIECRCSNGSYNRKRNCQPPECTCTGSNRVTDVCSFDNCLPIVTGNGTVVVVTSSICGLVVVALSLIGGVILYRKWGRISKLRRKRGSVKLQPQIVYVKPMVAEDRSRPSSCPYVNTEVMASGLVSQDLISVLHSHTNLLDTESPSNSYSPSGYHRSSFAFPKAPELQATLYENYYFS